MRETTWRAMETPALACLPRPTCPFLPSYYLYMLLAGACDAGSLFSNRFCVFVNQPPTLQYYACCFSFVLHFLDLRFGGFISRSEKSTVLFLRRHFNVNRKPLCFYKRHYNHFQLSSHFLDGVVLIYVHLLAKTVFTFLR